MENDFVTIAQFQFAHDAGLPILQERLDEAGIEYLVFNENMGSVAPLGTWAGGGIELRVHPEHATQATAIWEAVQQLVEYSDYEDPELAEMRQKENAIAHRNWNACLFSLVILGTAFWVLHVMGLI